MTQCLKAVCIGIATLIIFVVLFFLGAALVEGMVTVSAVVYPWISRIAGTCLMLNLILLPLALFRKLRRLLSFMLLVSSYIFGLSIWLYSCLVSFILWGYAGLFAGLTGFGIGVVPIAFLATLLGRN